MNYEQKYKEALNKAKHALDCDKEGLVSTDRVVLESIFPELRENEDEKIRKELIQYLNDYPNLPNGSYSRDDFYAWLEKQKPTQKGKTALEAINEVKTDNANYVKQKPKFKVGDTIIKKHNSNINDFGRFTITDITGEKYWYNDRIICNINEQDEWKLAKPKPKFNEGDWIVWKNCIYKILDNKYTYTVINIDGLESRYEHSTIDDIAYLWTIQDAIDGDILTVSRYGEWIGIFKAHTGCTFTSHCFLNGFLEFVNNPNRCKSHGTHGIHPATKEQCDLLFQKMREAGYEWDTDKKELKKIEPVEMKLAEESLDVDSETYSKIVDECIYNEQKSTNKVEPNTTTKSLSEFEEALADICRGYIGEELGWEDYIKTNADALLKIAFKMWNDVQDAPFEKLAEGSEEDEKIRKAIHIYLDWLDGRKDYAPRGEYIIRDMIAWLKSLKERLNK